MGQNQTNPFSENSPLMSEYRIDGRDLQHNQTYLTHLRTEKQFLLKEFTFNEIREFTIVSEKLKTRQKLHSQYLTIIKTVEQRTQDQMCSNFYKIYTLWDYPHRTLEQEIRLRSNVTKHFSNKEIFDILSSSIKGLRELQELQIKHESLTTKSILLQKRGLIKVADPFTGSFISNIDALFNNRSSKSVYLSPQQCQSLEQQKPIIEKNSFKNDVFVLGMIVLQCGLLTSQNECYLEDFSQVKWNQINLSLNAFGEFYDQRLKNMVQSMLNKDIKARPDWIMLYRSIQNEVSSNNSQFDYSYPSPLTTIRTLQSQNANPHSNFRPNLIQTRLTQNTNVNLTYQTPKLNTFKTLSSHKSANVMPISIAPIINIRQPEITPVLTSSPMKQISFNMKNPTNIYTQLKTSIPSTQPIGSTAYNNITRLYVEKPPVMLSMPINKTSIQNMNSGMYGFDNTFGGLRNKKQPVQLQFIQNSQPQRLQSNRMVQKETLQQKQQKVQTKYHQSSPGKYQSQQPQFVEEFFKMGSRYQGYKLNGMRQGRGKFFYQDGGSYDGDWKKNKMNGQGTLYYQSNKKAYEGEWLDDQFHGLGTLYNQNPLVLSEGFDYRNFDEIEDYWAYYKGQFKTDSKHGYGILKFSNGEQFKGNFVEDMVQGEGYFTTIRQIKIRGVWSQNHLIQLLN